MRIAFEKKKNTFSFRGQKSWLVSTNVDMILLFVKLGKTIKLHLNDRETVLTSVIAPIYKEHSVTRKTFEKRNFLTNLNQGNLMLRNTKILAKNTLSGKLIRGFAASEQFFVMLSLGIFFITKVKNVNLKKKFFNVVQALLNDFNTPLSLRLTVKRHRISFIKMIDIFDKLPERKAITRWNIDKIMFLKLLN
jgi:hypothetical protein